MKDPISLIQKGFQLVRFTSGDENNGPRGIGSYWNRGLETVFSRHKYDHTTVSVLMQGVDAKKVVVGRETLGEILRERNAMFNDIMALLAKVEALESENAALRGDLTNKK